MQLTGRCARSRMTQVHLHTSQLRLAPSDKPLQTQQCQLPSSSGHPPSIPPPPTHACTSHPCTTPLLSPADFGLSRLMEAEQAQVLTQTCGTVGWVAPLLIWLIPGGPIANLSSTLAGGVVTVCTLQTPCWIRAHADSKEGVFAR